MCVCARAYEYLVVLGLSYSIQELQSSLQYIGSFSCGMAILSGKSHGEWSLVGNSPWDHKELATTEWLSTWIIFSCSMQTLSCDVQTLSCSMWHRVPWPGIEPRSPALGAWHLSPWINREVPITSVYWDYVCFLRKCNHWLYGAQLKENNSTFF